MLRRFRCVEIFLGTTLSSACEAHLYGLLITSSIFPELIKMIVITYQVHTRQDLGKAPCERSHIKYL